MTRLGRTVVVPEAPVRSTRLAAAVAGGPLSRELIEIPRLGPAWIVLAGHSTVQRIEGETYAEMEKLGIGLSALTALTYEAERAVRTLAEAVRDPDDVALAFGTLVEWQGLDSDTIAGAWFVYGDVRERLDPMVGAISDEDLKAIRQAVSKKNLIQLRSFGVSKLAASMITTGDPPSNSPSPKSTPGE